MNPFGIILIIATALYPTYQLFILQDIIDKVALFSQCLGLFALVLMAWGQILATRIPGIESIFGGLDRVYVLHKWAGIAAMGAILLHDTIDAEMRGLGRETFLNELAETLGEISLYGLLILVVISVSTFIPYHLWKWTHKAMGALFATGTFHFFFIMKPFDMSDPAGLYTGFFCIAGLIAYAWTLFPERMRPSHSYNISKLEQTGDALAISMKPNARGLKPEPGQFGILCFLGAGKNEPHPFSFSKIDRDGVLRVSIKALGDYTNSLEGALDIGQEVSIQGPFGRFRHRGNDREVWISGGIGITPILAWAEALTLDDGYVDLFYCVRSRETAPHLLEIQEIAKIKPNLNLHLFSSAEGDRLSADAVAEFVDADLSSIKISFCGPISLRRSLQKDLHRYGITSRNFHYEEFEFRTGIGLKRLAHWILTKTRIEDHRNKGFGSGN